MVNVESMAMMGMNFWMVAQNFYPLNGWLAGWVAGAGGLAGGERSMRVLSIVSLHNKFYTVLASTVFPR